MSELTAYGEQELLSRLFVGDPAILETLIHAYFAVLCRFAEKFLPDASLAKDVAQESFIKLWKSDKTFDSANALKAWLYTTTRNGCLDLIRSRGRMEDKHQSGSAGQQETEEPILAAIIRAETVAQIYQAVKAMPEKMQAVFLLSFREGMTVSEIAVQLGMNLKAVKKQKYKALVALRGRFGGQQQPLLNLITAAIVLGESSFK